MLVEEMAKQDLEMLVEEMNKQDCEMFILSFHHRLSPRILSGEPFASLMRITTIEGNQ